MLETRLRSSKQAIRRALRGTYVVCIRVRSVKVLVALGGTHVELFAHFVHVVLVFVVFIIVLVLEFLRADETLSVMAKDPTR